MNEMFPDAADSADSRTVGPVTAAERNIAIDTLRGVAILGILVMNIYAFAMPLIAYSNPLAMGGTEPHNIGTWYFTHIFFDQKFLSIFAMLFGAGLIMMQGRAERRGAKFGRIYYRRLFWLSIIGLAHGYLLWFGDILFHYAIMGMLVFLFRNRSPRTLIIVACVVLPIGTLIMYGASVNIEKMQVEVAEIEQQIDAGAVISDEQQELLNDWRELSSFMAPTEEDLRKDVVGYSGNYIEVVKYRAPVFSTLLIQASVTFILWRVAPLMLIGMALMKLGVLSGDRPSGFYLKLVSVCYVVGLPLTVFSAVNLHAHQFEPLYAFRVGMIPNYFGSIIVALGHIGLVMLIVKSGVLARTMTRFAAVGQMALTNYLMHSAILTSVFYGYGLGLYGQVPRLAQMSFVAIMIGLQLAISPWWLGRFRFGPVEWLWRSLSYWQRQPMRRSRT